MAEQGQQQRIERIAYRQEGQAPRHAAVVDVELELSGLSEQELQLAGHLIAAAEAMNPIFRDQFDPRTALLRKLATAMHGHGKDEAERKAIDDYRTMLDMQNSPWSLLPRKNHLLDLPRERTEELVRLAAPEVPDAPELIAQLLPLMSEGLATPRTANFYPHDIDESELDSLGEHAKRVNSSVLRDDEGDLWVVLNEERYRESISVAAIHLAAARDLAPDPGFRLYLDAKLTELETGSLEARRVADALWVRHNYKLDIVISSALEVYLDDLRNYRGAASAGVYLVNESKQELLDALIERVPAWEGSAPWKYRRESIDPETLPKLKFVDVLCWSGDYVTAPFTTIAQSLPNDEWVGKQIGTVNMVYTNTGRAVHKVAGGLAAREFLPAEDYEAVAELLFDAGQLHSALHEIGHTTGRQSEQAPGQPSDYLAEEYSFLEESRAELFGLWSLRLLVEQGVIPAELARACYASMTVSMASALRFEPAQAHTRARNGMLHAFEEAGVLERVNEQDRRVFKFHPADAHEVVSRLLGEIADIKARGDKAAAVSLREARVFDDPMRDEIEARMADFPLGRGLIFPRLRERDGHYSRDVELPASFSEQRKFNLPLLD